MNGNYTFKSCEIPPAFLNIGGYNPIHTLPDITGELSKTRTPLREQLSCGLCAV